jgi:exopolyphosphatase/guanosine-5'-triphosphate,3'-diphosphate pyrophosphatase
MSHVETIVWIAVHGLALSAFIYAGRFINKGKPLKTVVRAAFDVGSGTTKLTVARVEVQNGPTNNASLLAPSGKIVEILGEGHIDVLFGHDFKQSAERKILSDKIFQQGLEAIRNLKAKAEKLAGSQVGELQFAGIATAVFREASNGSQFIETVKRELGIPFSVISQDEEAQIGFVTACAAVPDIAVSNVLSWDSGGASFQIAGFDENGSFVNFLYIVLM